VSRVIFMCGPSGSGKSTYAQRFESEGMVRLSFDVEMWRRGISTVPLPQDVRDEIEAGLRARLLELVADRETVLNRVRARRGSHADDFVLTEELAAQYFDHFGPPTPDEGPLTVIR
jgi:predicted kinase